MEDLEAPVSFLLSQAQHRVTRRLEPLFAAHDCSLERWHVLCGLALNGAQRGHPMSDVATFAALPAPSATKLVDGMVADNLVYRRADVHDRRRVLVFLTPRGRALHRRLTLAVQDEEQRLTGPALSAEDGEALAALLTRLVASLDGGHRPDRVPGSV